MNNGQFAEKLAVISLSRLEKSLMPAGRNYFQSLLVKEFFLGQLNKLS